MSVTLDKGPTVLYRMTSGAPASVVHRDATHVTVRYVSGPMVDRSARYHAEEIGDYFSPIAPLKLDRRSSRR